MNESQIGPVNISLFCQVLLGFMTDLVFEVTKIIILTWLLNRIFKGFLIHVNRSHVNRFFGGIWETCIIAK